MAWKPAFKKNTRFKNLPPVNSFLTFKKEDKINENFIYDEELFPCLGDYQNNKKEENNKENNNEWCDILKQNKEKIKIKEEKKEIILQKIEWTEEDDLDEYFNIMYGDFVTNISLYTEDYCYANGLTIYNKYDKCYNLFDLVKYTSTEYNNIFKKHQENKEEEEKMDEEIIEEEELDIL